MQKDGHGSSDTSAQSSPVSEGGWQTHGGDAAGKACPLVSIITVVRNGCQTIARTIESVETQSVDFEYIIIDGNSSDHTLDLIRAADKRGAVAYWRSEPDTGIFDAMNKGVRHARGEWLYFLGADDYLASPSVLADALRDLPVETQIVCGDVQLGDGGQFKSSLGAKTNVINTLHHQGTLYRRSLFQDFQYNPELRIVADYELTFRIYRNRRPYVYRPLLIAVCIQTGVSNTSSEWANYREMFRARASYVSWPFNAACYLLGCTNVLRRRLLSTRR